MAVINWTNRRRLMSGARDVERSQLKLLNSIIVANRQTKFGRDHNFSSISDWHSFRKNIAIQTYASLEPYINAQVETGETTLVDSALVSLARTSGSTGPTKDIPMTKAGLENIKDAQRQLALTLYKKTGFFDGEILALFSPHVEGRLKNGLAYGSSSGQANRNTSMLFRSKFVYPAEITAIGDYDLKYYLFVLFGILEANVTGIATANPSSICRLAEIVNQRREELKTDLVNGDIRASKNISDNVLTEKFRKICVQRQGRVNEIVSLLDKPDEINLSDIWPNLSAAAVWTGGSCGLALEKLKKTVPAQTKFVELGYRASEFIGSTNIDAEHNLCLPTLQHTVFEFVEQSLWESECAEFTPMSKLEVGANYYVFVTTSCGLYRYDINDVVTVTGYYGACPSISFLQKGKGVTSITGEKLYLHQSLEAVTCTQSELGTELDFCILLANEAAARYDGLIELKNPGIGLAEKFATGLDRNLMKFNIEYSEKRASGRLKKPTILLLKPGAGEAVKRRAIVNGQREAQYKPPCLEYSSKFDFDFEPWLVGDQSK
jgi:hypothetical protein